MRQSEIVDAIRAGARSVAEVGEHCEAGTGCHSCHAAILALLEDDVHMKLARGEAPEQLQQLPLFEVGGPPRGPGGAARKPRSGGDQPDSAE